MTNIDEFNHRECDKLDANKINAYVDLSIDKDNDTAIRVDSSWGSNLIDLKPIVKKSETVTTMHLSSEENPTCLVFEREDGQSDCIHGDDLSRIISMAKLKDVDQSKTPANGDVYMYQNGKFVTFNLGDFVNMVNGTLENINQVLSVLRNQIQPIVNRWNLPEGVPDDAKILLGNINLYSDTNAVVNASGVATSLNKSHGIYGHSLNEDKAQDELFG